MLVSAVPARPPKSVSHRQREGTRTNSKEMNTMSEQKTKILQLLDEALNIMPENDEAYLMGFLECAAAMANNQRTPPAAQ